MSACLLPTRELIERLQRHYIKPGEPLPGGIFLPEVGWNGGSRGTGGTCDALYVGFTGTSGRILVGHELKVSRADWVKELTSPGKADGWADECHQWYLVVGDPEIVRDGELPVGWGLMVPGRSKTRMDIKVPAETKRDHTPSWLAVRSIIARQDTLRAQAISAGQRKAADAARASVQEQVEQRLAQEQGITREVEVARRIVKAVSERRLRLPGEAEAEKLADAVCEILDGHQLLTNWRHLVQHRLNQLENATKDMRTGYQYKALIEALNPAVNGAVVPL